MAKRFYQCTCFKRCKGGREVSRSTYHRHGPIREDERLASHSHGSVVGDSHSIVGGNDDSSDSEEEEGEEDSDDGMQTGRGSMGLESDPGNLSCEPEV